MRLHLSFTSRSCPGRAAGHGARGGSAVINTALKSRNQKADHIPLQTDRILTISCSLPQEVRANDWGLQVVAEPGGISESETNL